MKKKTINFYLIFVLLAMLDFYLIFSKNAIIEEFTFALLGVLFLVASILGIATRSFFLGRAVILPYESDPLITKVANAVVGIVGISLVVLNIFNVYFKKG